MRLKGFLASPGSFFFETDGFYALLSLGPPNPIIFGFGYALPADRLSSKIEVRNEVLISAPDAPKSMTFHIKNSYLGSSLIDSDTRATTPVDVPTARYSEVHADFAPDVLLMDIEGFGGQPPTK